MADENDEMSETELEAFLAEHPVTLPAFAYTFRGVDDEATRNAMAAAMSPLAAFMSRIVSLEGLDGITIATDYRQALTELDRGVETTSTNEPTAEAFGTGVAMSNGVVRDGRMKTHVTFEAGIIDCLIGEDEGLRELSVHTFMHELGHVAEHTLDHNRFGSTMLEPMADPYEFELYRLSHACWSEYYASRVSAPWGEHAMDGLRELLRGSIGQLVERAGTARSGIGILAGRLNDAVAMEIMDQVSKMMKFAGYVIGHARGAATEPIETGSAEDTMLEELGLRIWFDELAEKLHAIYEARHDWEALSVFHPLHRSFEIACLSFKLQLRRSDEYSLAWRIFF